jgi:NADPH:quinone reductase-like Zn-dependent oxidoreductase
MRAIVYTEYGSPDVLHLQEVEKPTPKDNELLIKIFATPVGFGDILARKFNTTTPSNFTMPSPLWFLSRLEFGFNKPRKLILGSEFSGEVEAVGSAVTRFKPGDRVFGYRGQNFGANAEYLCMAETGSVTTSPSNLTPEEAATVPYGALTALNLLKKTNIQPGQKVLINGASGGIGSAALQLAKHSGAEVTGVCGTRRVDMVKALGADHVIDYTTEDFTQNGETYDLILDILGKSSFAACRESLTPNGIYQLVSFKIKHLLQMLWTSLRDGKKVVCALAFDKQEDLVHIRELVEAGQYKTAIDRCFPLEQAAEAHRYVEAGQRTGSVVLSVAQP